jgi:gamma-glutamyltranspeptidase/glutathione hydrolase
MKKPRGIRIPPSSRHAELELIPIGRGKLFMTSRCNRRTFLAVAGGTLTGLAATRALGAAPAEKNEGIVIGNPEGAEAAKEIFAAGGNAVDAIVAAALVAGVTAVPMCGIGGYGGHMTVSIPNGKVTSIDFNSVAPAAARPDMFPLDDKGQVKNDVHMTGWLAAGVPGTLAGLQLALDKFGTLPFTRVVQPAIRIARNGFPVSLQFKHWLDLTIPQLARDPESARLLLPRGKPLARGETFRNPELADMLQKLAESGSVEPFYRGDIASSIAAEFKRHGGIVTEKDFANYQAVEQTPLKRDRFGHTIATAPLTAGGLSVLQVCGTIEALEWAHMPKDGTTRTHAMLESLRIAWSDRLRLFGDPNFVDLPVEHLLSEQYARKSAQRVKQAVAEKRPVAVSTDGRTAGGTINLSAADSSGTMAAMTLTHGDAFGARVTVPGLGLILGHGMSRFDPVPGKLNSIDPGKRPLDNMCPSIVLKDGRPVMALGGTGGRRIPNAIFQVLLHALAEGRSLEESVTAPRLHTEGGMEVRVERGWPQTDVNFLKSIGYKFEPPMGSFVSAVQLDRSKDGRPQLLAVGDVQAEHSDPPGMRQEHPVVVRPR